MVDQELRARYSSSFSAKVTGLVDLAGGWERGQRLWR